MENNRQVAVFGGGCFWCVEAVFMEIKGVTSIASGYSGGHVENPSYYAVSYTHLTLPTKRIV